MENTFEFGSILCERFVLGPFQVNTYLLFERESKELLIIDPAISSAELFKKIKNLEPKSTIIFLTHCHADHILGLDATKAATQGKIVCSKEDSVMLGNPLLNLSQFFGTPMTVGPQDEFVEHEQEIPLGKYKGKVLSIPGHSPGGIILDFPEMVFTGDTLFAGGIGRSDFPGGDGRQLVKMIRERILTMPDKIVFPGHGPESDIATEKAENPFVSEWADSSLIG